MLISKFDLYKSEWLELVFDDRNKEYGAYDLRKHYSNTLVKAMSITFIGVALLLTAQHILYKPKPFEHTTVVEFKTLPPPTTTKPPIVPPRVEPPKPHVQVSTVRFPPPVVRPDEAAVEPPKLTELQTAAIGTKNQKGVDDGANIDIPESSAGGGMAKVTEDDKLREMNAVEVLPQPVGGAEAWAKFLQKNMHYPAQASDNHVQGKVIVSFVVGKDGRISDIVVDRGPGYGLDEEATRVLRMAPAWKPGIQNGRPVSVRFTLPITFVIPDSDN